MTYEEFSAAPEVKLHTPTLRKLIGKQIAYCLSNTYFDLRQGTIDEIIRRQIGISGDFIPFSRIKKIVLI